MTDVIVVGSGPGGTNAAARLVEADLLARLYLHYPTVVDRHLHRAETQAADGAEHVGFDWCK